MPFTTSIITPEGVEVTLDLLPYARTLTWQSKSIDPTELIWFGARYYNPKTGCFLSPDPLGTLTCLNLYTYANGDPINFQDLNGRFASPIYRPIINSIDYALSNTRVQGALEAFGGIGEMGAGAAIIGASEGLLAISGWAIVAHGASHASAGAYKLFTGRDTDTLVSQGLQTLGVSREVANFTDDIARDISVVRTGQMALSAQGGRSINTFPKASPTSSRIYEKNLKHTFRSAKGHFLDTPPHRKLLTNTASNPKNYLGKDKFGNIWHAEIQKDGTQIWTVSRDGQIRHGGLNQHPRPFKLNTGLSRRKR